MQEYLHKSRFSGIVDTIGLHGLMLLLALGWFLLLWGLCLPSLLAGLALYLMGALFLRKARDGRLIRKERQLRLRIGGEMALERLLTVLPSRAHFEITMLLSLKHPLTMLRTGDNGILCSLKGEQILISFLQSPFSGQVSADDVLRLQRQARAMRAKRAVLCAPCPIAAAAREQAAGDIPVSFLSRDTLIHLLGSANPATDAQLVALGRRRRSRIPRRQWLRAILDPRKAPRYALYGGLLLGLYLITKLFYYALTGLICLGLAAACRCRRAEKESL